MPVPVPLLIAAGVALYLVASKKGPSGATGEVISEGAISDDEAALLERLPDGHLRYKDGQSLLLPLMSLQSKSLLPTSSDAVFGLKQALSLDAVPPSAVGARVVANAYEAAKDLHARGFDVWVTPTLLPRKDQVFAARYLVAVTPGPPDNGTPPGPSSTVELQAPKTTANLGLLALLRRASEPWITEVPAPPPPFAAPPPPGV